MRTQREPESIHQEVFVAQNATITGEVYIDAESSIWFGVVIRGDVAPIRIGKQTNIQDLACLHADPGFPCIIGDRVTVGHGAIVHGATVQDNCLIGIRSVILNGAQIGEYSIIGAGAVVTEGKSIPPRSLVLGVPGKVVRTVTEEDITRIHHGAEHYAFAARAYRKGTPP